MRVWMYSRGSLLCVVFFLSHLKSRLFKALSSSGQPFTPGTRQYKVNLFLFLFSPWYCCVDVNRASPFYVRKSNNDWILKICTEIRLSTTFWKSVLCLCALLPQLILLFLVFLFRYRREWQFSRFVFCLHVEFPISLHPSMKAFGFRIAPWDAVTVQPFLSFFLSHFYWLSVVFYFH